MNLKALPKQFRYLLLSVGLFLIPWVSAAFGFPFPKIVAAASTILGSLGIVISILWLMLEKDET